MASNSQEIFLKSDHFQLPERTRNILIFILHTEALFLSLFMRTKSLFLWLEIMLNTHFGLWIEMKMKTKRRKI